MKKHVSLLAIVAALVIAPFAIAAGEGEPLRQGARNPSSNQSQALTSETQVIADNGTYGTRQSNKSDTGGGAIYGCRAKAGSNACVRAVNLANGHAFEFASSSGAEGGRIDVGAGGDGTRPFSTNATGVATGLNADRVDGYDSAQLVARFALVAATGALQGGRGAASAERTAAGTYTVRFGEPITGCAYTATVIGSDALGFATIEPVDANVLRVRTAQRAGDNPLADRAFHLVVTC